MNASTGKPATNAALRHQKPWAVVLAGGDGTRMRSLVQRIHPDGRPKQFAAVFGSRSLLRETLDRVGVLIPAERTVIVGNRAHERYLAEELSDGPGRTVLLQPGNRGTAAGILFPLHWIVQRDEQAVVAIFPSDHFIVGNHAFMAHVSQTMAFAEASPGQFLLVGAPPSRPEPDLGWVETGPPVGATASGPICTVVRFREKPAPEEARIFFQNGFLWNTFVVVGRAATIVRAGWDLAPGISERADLAARAVAEGNTGALEAAYADLPDADFSRSILERCPERLVISRLPDRIWSDWGTPDRVVQSLTDARLPVPPVLRDDPPRSPDATPPAAAIAV